MVCAYKRKTHLTTPRSGRIKSRVFIWTVLSLSKGSSTIVKLFTILRHEYEKHKQILISSILGTRTKIYVAKHITYQRNGRTIFYTINLCYTLPFSVSLSLSISKSLLYGCVRFAYFPISTAKCIFPFSLISYSADY